MHNFRELRIWKDAIAVAKQVYIISADFPSEEKFGLASQVRRAVVSIASNIGEGAGRLSNKEFAHFLTIAQGLAYEVETQLFLAKEFEFISDEKLNGTLDSLIPLQKMISSFREYLIRK